MIKRLIVALSIGLLGITSVFAQTGANKTTNKLALREFSQNAASTYQREHQEAIQVAQEKGWPIRKVYPDGRIIELQRLADNGMPIYYTTNNLNAAKTVSTDKVWPSGNLGFFLTGFSMTVGEWDGGGVRTTHQEFGGRVNQMDSPGSTSEHSTHVAGTMIAAGVDPDAKGMAFEANLNAYDWNSDESEMASAASNGLLESNHSYGQITGWEWNYRDDNKWAWFGNTSISQTEDYRFGFYTSQSQSWDDIAFNAPHYLIVKSAGNDRNNSGPAANTPYWVYNGGNWQLDSTTVRNPDGQYDCIPEKGVSKNVLTIGAANPIPSGYTNPSDVSMTSFSSWGPADDGRIKPDITADGANVYSTSDSTDSYYVNMSGTSMSSPNTTGSLALLREIYQSTNPDTMLSSTLKGLVIHTADEAGANEGPDYQYGWGLLNTLKASEVISNEGVDRSNLIQEYDLLDGNSYSLEIESNGLEPLRATIAWTDPPGTPVAASVDPTNKMLVNDLDLWLEGPDGSHFPYVLDPTNPGNAATTGDNSTDNVEQVYIQNPVEGMYTLHVDHKSSLTNGDQVFSLVVSGAAAFAGGNPKPTDLVAGNNFDGMVPLSWDPAVGVNPGSRFSEKTNNILSDAKFASRIQTSSNHSTPRAAAAGPTVDYYRVYRRTDKSEPYQMIGEVHPDQRYYLDNQDFVDNNVNNDSTYFYAVSAVYTTGGEGSLTDPVSATPQSNGHILNSSFTTDTPVIDGDIVSSNWNQATIQQLTSVSPMSATVEAYVQNDGQYLYIAVRDQQNSSPSDYNEVGIYFDTDNNGSWDSSIPSSEGNYWVTMDNGVVTQSFRPIYGNYPSDVGAESRINDPAGFTAAAQHSGSTLEYEIRIDLLNSVLNAMPGDTIGFRIYNLDQDRLTEMYYGMDSWPYGNVWIAPETYGKLALSTSGSPRPDAPVISTIQDVPEDQGGEVSITWQASSAENSVDNPVTYYQIWRHSLAENSNESTEQTLEASSDIEKQAHGSEPQLSNSNHWVKIDSIPASGESAYQHQVSTFADSNSAGIHTVEFKVAAYGESGDAIFSQTQSGYSIDNIDPSVPTEVTISGNTESVTVHWQANTDPDIDRYSIFRASEAATTPSPRVDTDIATSDTVLTVSGENVATDFYCVAAIDQNGNSSGYSTPVSLKTTSNSESVAIPDHFVLEQNYPNPFNPTTNIRYAIPGKEYVTLTVYDLLGNYITTLVQKTQSAGWYSIQWNGMDQKHQQVGTGMYLYRIEAGQYRSVKKMIYMK